jgi:hypothetical protein
MEKDVIWGWITKILVFAYVTIGGGYELYSGIVHGQIQSSFVFAFLSGAIFVGRIGYGIASGAKKTVPADMYGLVVMWTIAFMRFYLNGF